MITRAQTRLLAIGGPADGKMVNIPLVHDRAYVRVYPRMEGSQPWGNISDKPMTITQTMYRAHRLRVPDGEEYRELWFAAPEVVTPYAALAMLLQAYHKS
jgi:hypothetical protein